MNVKDILIDMKLLDEQYRFIVSRFHNEWWNYESQGLKMPNSDIDMWEGILNLFETVLESENPLDIPRQIVVE